MKLNKCLIFALIALTLFSLIAIPSVKSEPPHFIVISGDGSVSDKNSIQRSGNFYSLTGDLSNSSIIVRCNNIILDGKGYTLQGPTGWVSGLCAINLTCTNTTVQNFNIVGFWEVGILGNYNGNTICKNNITKTDRAISIYASDYNIRGNYLAYNDRAIRIVGNHVIIYGNTIADNANGLFLTNSSDNVIVANEFESNIIAVSTDYGGFEIYHNNFINQTVGHDGVWSAMVLSTAQDVNVTIPPWDSGYLSGGNYWSDYASRYPNASEIVNSGIGDTAYVIGFEGSINSTTIGYFIKAVDRYPLFAPVNISETNIELILMVPNASPSPPPSSTLPSASLTPSPSTPEFPPAMILLVLIVVAIGFGLIVYFKKNGKKNHKISKKVGFICVFQAIEGCSYFMGCLIIVFSFSGAVVDGLFK
jgi:parallel beta-helix repeat protein